MGRRRIELFGQLLGDSRTAAGILALHNQRLYQHTHHGSHIYPRMILKTGILSGNQSIYHMLRNLRIIGIDTVARIAVITPHLLPVGSVEHRGEFVIRIFKLFDRRHIPYPAVIHQKEKHNNTCESEGENAPHPSDNESVTALARRGFYIFVGHDNWSSECDCESGVTILPQSSKSQSYEIRLNLHPPAPLIKSFSQTITAHKTATKRHYAERQHNAVNSG